MRKSCLKKPSCFPGFLALIPFAIAEVSQDPPEHPHKLIEKACRFRPPFPFMVKVGSRISVKGQAKSMELVLYSKPGCHLCEGLQEKLEALDYLDFTLEIRDITNRTEWFAAYQYEIPVLCRVVPTAAGCREEILPRLSPRASVEKVAQMLQTYLDEDGAK